MKKLAIAAAVLLAFNSHVWAQQTHGYDDRPKINVNGEAVVYAKPDKIVIAFGIETWDKNSIEAAKKKNNDILKKTVAAIKECDVPAKEIQTDHLCVQPRYKNGYYTVEDFIGYFVQNTFIVTLDDTAKVEQLVSKALAAGVTHVHDINFQTTEFKKYREQARELALKAAKEKAEKMAGVLGQSIGRPLQISENYYGMPGNYYSNWWWGHWGHGQFNGMTQNAVQDMRGGSGEISDTIAMGKISIRANVGVTFELKQ